MPSYFFCTLRFLLLAGAVALLHIATPQLAPQMPSGPPSGNRTFTSPDGVFTFKYPDSLIQCKQIDPKNPDHWTPDDSCVSYTPVCDDDAHSGDTVACVAYPANKAKGTNLEAAAFSIAEVKGDYTAALCLGGVPDRDYPVHTTRINGVDFRTSEVDGVGSGHSLDGYVYRDFHNDKCYELDVRIAVTNPALFDPGTVRRIDLERVRKPLDQALKSFRFLK